MGFTQENGHAVFNLPGHHWLFWLEISESAQFLVDASSCSLFGSSPTDRCFPSLPQAHSPSLTHLSSAQTPSRRIVNTHGFNLGFGNPGARALVGNIVASMQLSPPEVLEAGCGHLCFNSN